MSEIDPFGRPPISGTIKKAISEAFAIVPPGDSSAFLGIVDQNGARIHLAWRVADKWQVGAVVDAPFGGKPSGWVGVMGSW